MYLMMEMLIVLFTSIKMRVRATVIGTVKYLRANVKKVYKFGEILITI